jgi:DNA-binding HxlR family transcriptional regulator
MVHEESEEIPYARALESAVALIRGKWAIAVLSALAGGPLRLSDLLDHINEHHRQRDERPLSVKVLTDTLRPLVDASLVENAKEPDAFAAPSWYGLTHHGRTLIRSARPLVKWYHEYVDPSAPLDLLT